MRVVRGLGSNSPESGAALLAAVTNIADRFVADLGPVISDIHAARYVSLQAIAAELTARAMLTRRGGKWVVGNVKGVLGGGFFLNSSTDTAASICDRPSDQ